MRVDPVNDSLRTTGLAVSSAPMASGRPVTMLTTPAGMPARSASTLSAGAVLRVTGAFGKFPSVMMAKTPTGSFSARIFLPGTGEGMTLPLIRRAYSANQRTKLTP